MKRYFMTKNSFVAEVTFKENSRFTSRKRGLSLHRAMHHFDVITPIMMLFHESRPEKRVNYPITPCITSMPSRQLFCYFTNHALKKWPNTPSANRWGCLFYSMFDHFPTLYVKELKSPPTFHPSSCFCSHTRITRFVVSSTC